MQAVLALVERVARSDSAVLILGESGTGKELDRAHAAPALAPRDRAARRHQLRARFRMRWSRVSCSATSAARIAEASTRKLGLFELANGGTIFMDEIGALDPKVQGKLLRALEHGTFYRVGGTQKVRSDLRVVAASNQDLAQRVANGTFRSDLYYRINTISMTLPPLRERAVDIPLLARHFLEHASDGVARSLSPDAIDALQAYPWPGNVRELRNVIERAVLLATGSVIHANDVPLRRTSRVERRPRDRSARAARAGGAPAHRDGAAARALASGQGGRHPRHLAQDALPEDPRVRAASPERAMSARAE